MEAVVDSSVAVEAVVSSVLVNNVDDVISWVDDDKTEVDDAENESGWTKITIIFIQCLQFSYIWCVFNNLVDPFNTSYHFIPFLFVENWRTFVFNYFLVRMNTDD
jgi:hypothetical protein